METRLLCALYAKPAPKVLGRRLEPFCLAHRVALLAIGSPFAGTSQRIGPDDLLAALRICSSREPFAPIPAPSISEKVEYWRLRNSPARLEIACREFLAYVSDHTAHPDLWAKEAQSPSDGIPWPLHVVARLVRNGIPERDAWRMSEGRAVWLNITFARQEGAELSIISEAERQLMRSLDNLNAKPAHG